MATFKNAGILDYELPGDGTRPAVVVEPGDEVDADWNPNGLYFEWVSGEPPDGAGDFNDPDQPAADDETAEQTEELPAAPADPEE